MSVCKNVSTSYAFLVFIIFLNQGLCKRIVGGKPAQEGELPYQVGLRRLYSYSHYCGGTLITDSHILTAAHCVCSPFNNELVSFDPRYIVAIAGQTNLKVTNTTVVRNIIKIVFHKSYDSESMANDIGIMQVNRPFPVNSHSYIRPVPLNNVSLGSNTTCIVSGWGVLKHDSIVPNSILSLVEVQIINFTQCSSMYGIDGVALSSGMLCAGTFEGGKDACQGDSGGPLVCGSVLSGVVSTGSGCADMRYPGIYSDVSYFLPWIKKTLEEMADVSSSTENNVQLSTTSTLISNITANITNINTTTTKDLTTELTMNTTANIPTNTSTVIINDDINVTLITTARPCSACCSFLSNILLLVTSSYYFVNYVQFN